jgi:hypothetical protein
MMLKFKEKPFTPPKQELIQVWHKSNSGFERKKYLKQKSKGLVMEILP